MAFTLIANNATYGDASGVTNGASINSTGANLIVVLGVNYDGVARPTLSDSKGNSWSEGITRARTGSDQEVTVFYCIPTSTGAAHTFSFGGTDTYASVFVQAYSGAASSSVYDTDRDSSAVTGSATTLAAGSVTPSADNYLVVFGLGLATTSTLSLDSPGTISNQLAWTSGQAYGGGMGYNIQTTPTPVNPAWSFSGGGTSMVAVAACFKVAVGGATRPVKMAGEWGGYAGPSGGFAG